VEIEIVQGDITEQDVDAIVNAANTMMRGGGGVDGAIHRAAGPDLLDECIERFPRGLATGDAGWTHGFRLRAPHVIHVVGPIHGVGSRDALTSCYRRALEVADRLGVGTIAFPLISAGVYSWPLEDAIDAALATLRATPTKVEMARLVAFDQATEALMRQRLSTT
jgi:O-acetyl-ADP-ribose deacetylase